MSTPEKTPRKTSGKDSEKAPGKMPQNAPQQAKKGASEQPSGSSDDGGFPLLSARAIVSVAIIIVLGLNVSGMFFPGVAAWGFNMWGEFPKWIGLTVLAIGIALALASFVSRQDDRGLQQKAAKSASGRAGVLLLVAGGAAVVFLLLRSRALVYGDGYAVVASSQSPIFSALTDVHALTKALPTLLFRLTVHGAQGLGLEPSLGISFVSAVCGGLAIIGLWLIARQVAGTVGQRLLVFLITLASGSTVLYFGHIEHYACSTAALIWLIVTTLWAIEERRRGSTWLAVASLAVLLVNAMLLPVVVVSLLAAYNAGRDKPVFAVGPVQLSYGVAFLLLFVAAAAFVTLQQVAGLGLGFVPPLSRQINEYWVFSWAHVRDVINLLLFVAPLGLAILVVSVGAGFRFRLKENPVLGYLASAAFATLLISFWLDPQLGAVRDWDLLSFCGVPLSLLGAVILIPTMKKQAAGISRATAVAVGVCVLCLVGPWVAEQMDQDSATARLDRLLWEDLHYSAAYNSAQRCVSWGTLLLSTMGREDLAEKYFRRFNATGGVSPAIWFNLGIILAGRREFDSAAVYMSKAVAVAPDNQRYRAALAKCYEDMKQAQPGDTLAGMPGGEQAQLVDAERTQGIKLAQTGHLEEALVHFRRAYQADSLDCSNVSNLALAYSGVKKEDSALMYLEEGLRLCPEQNHADIYQSILMSQLALHRYDEAAKTLEKYRAVNPSARDIGVFERKIQEGAKRQ